MRLTYFIMIVLLVSGCNNSSTSEDNVRKTSTSEDNVRKTSTSNRSVGLSEMAECNGAKQAANMIYNTLVSSGQKERAEKERDEIIAKACR